MQNQFQATLKLYLEQRGKEVGHSSWIDIDQSRIDAFAKDTLDYQYIHVDPKRAMETPFGGTVAHGFLSLSFLSWMLFDAVPQMNDAAVCINYGMNRVRFLAPVPSKSRIRGRFVLEEVEQKAPDRLLFTYTVTVEIEGNAKPALVAEWLLLAQLR
ncbi:MaoC family dehydratase [Brucella sp. BE17]|uniref:MaoC family dehydratase n=1 Tax=Brucella sp. BE17 TaxID=3142977 RepID=UPI0031BA66AD